MIRLPRPGPALWAAAACAMLFGGIGIALGVAWLSGATRSDGEAAEPPAPVDLASSALRRCPYCGTIESKRRITPATTEAHAAVYEYTVRMNDGSVSTFEEALPASWRLGERLTVIR